MKRVILFRDNGLKVIIPPQSVLAIIGVSAGAPKSNPNAKCLINFMIDQPDAAWLKDSAAKVFSDLVKADETQRRWAVLDLPEGDHAFIPAETIEAMQDIHQPEDAPETSAKSLVHFRQGHSIKQLFVRQSAEEVDAMCNDDAAPVALPSLPAPPPAKAKSRQKPGASR